MKNCLKNIIKKIPEENNEDTKKNENPSKKTKKEITT